MTRNTDKDWAAVAESEAYWAVLSVDEYRAKDLDEEGIRRFFSTGDDLINNVLGFVRHHLAADFRIERALDFGCGVGRLALPIARLAQSAVGVDIAPRMLELAAENARRMNLSNVEFVLSDDTLSKATGSFNFVNSYIVIQHIPPERGMALLTRLLHLLAIGGVGSIQLTYAKERRHFMHEGRHALFYRREGNVIQDVVPLVDRRPEGSITMYDYDLNQVYALISLIAGSPVLTIPTNDDGHPGVHFIFRKARDLPPAIAATL